MMDKHIIQLYFERSEDAIRLTAETYGRYLYTIAHRILHDKEEAEESVRVGAYVKSEGPYTSASFYSIGISDA